MKALKQNEDFIILREDEVLPPSTMDDVRGGLAMMGSDCGIFNCGLHNCTCNGSIFEYAGCPSYCTDLDMCPTLVLCPTLNQCSCLTAHSACPGHYIVDPAD